MANTLGDIVVNLTLNTQQFTQSMQQIQRQITNTTNNVNTSTNNMVNTITGGNQQISNSMNNLNSATHQMGQNFNNAGQNVSNALGSMLGSSRHLVRTLGTDMSSQRRILGAAMREYHRFASVGRQVPMDIAEQFSALPRHLQQYVARLRDSGQSVQAFTRLNQMYSARTIDAMRRTNDYMMGKTTQSQRLMDSFSRDTNLAPLTNGFLSLARSMEETAKRGTVLNLALQRIGPNASLYELQTQMQFISQGLMRARGAFIGWGVASLLAYGGMIKLATAVDKRVVPAFDKMKATWLDAMMPFITAFASGMVHVMNFVTAIGKMVNAFSEAHPVIFQVINSILMLALVLGALLAPLAVTGIWTEGVAASFTALWMIIKPFVTGMLATIGVALALATAMVTLYLAIKMLWTQSEAFRNSFINLWKGIKTAFDKEFLKPILQAWANVETAYHNFIAALTGGAGTTANLFKWIGDKLAPAINLLGKVLLPVLTVAFRVLGQVVAFVFNGLAKGLSLLAPAIANVTAFGKALTTAFSGGGNPVAIGQTISKVVETIVMALVGGIPKLVSLGTQLIQKIADGMGVSIPQLMQMVVTIITNVITQFMNMAPQIVTVGFQMIQGLVSGLLSALPTILNGLTQLVNYLLTTLTTLITTYLPVLLQAGITVLNAIIQGIVTNLPLVVTAIVQLIQMLINTLVTFLPVILNAGLQLLMAIVNGILQNLNLILLTVIQLITTFFDVVIQNLPMIINAGMQVLFALIDGIVKMLPSLVNLVVKLVNVIVDFFIKNLPLIITAGIKILLALIQGVIKILPQLITMALQVILTIANAIIQHLPQIIDAGVKILIALVDGLIKTIPQLVAAIPKIITAIFKAFSQVHWGDIGKQIMNGIGAGIAKAKTALFGTVKDIAGGLLKAGKKALGIKSPSREFAKQVGQWIPKGIAVGIENEADIPVNAVRSISNDMLGTKPVSRSIPFSSLSLDGAGNNTSTTHITNHNIINATVKELADIQRIADELDKRQRQLDRAKGIVSFR